jgi:hypothetical protein
MAAITNCAQNDVFYHNFGSTTDTNIIQVAIPRFLCPANQMVPSAMTSHDRHIRFQDGRHCTVNASHSTSPIPFAQKKAPAMKSKFSYCTWQLVPF